MEQGGVTATPKSPTLAVGLFYCLGALSISARKAVA
jgi:hypothetical protein